VPAILIRCDGGASLGMGHVSRCLALADELRGAQRCGVIFAMRDADSAGAAAVRACGYPVAPITDPYDADYGPALQALTARHAARALVVDVRDALSRASLDAVRASGVRVVTIDDASDRRLASDLAFYPPVPQVEELDWSAFAGRRLSGWEWVLIKREFSADAVPRALHAASHPIDVLVTMGGSDPAGMTELALEALNLLKTPMAVQVVIGPAFARAAALAAVVARSVHAVRVTQGPEAMAPLMRESRVAVASFGVSAYELAACGVPAVYLCLTADHARSASAFVRAQIAESLGVVGEVRPDAIAASVVRLLDDPLRLDAMAARARSLVDGRGASRVAALVAAELV
jgi:spore coat polysaccharide biosynthesis predicted glycosyltransferase SpsG